MLQSLYITGMVTRGKKKWRGFVRAEDLSAEQLQRFRLYYERYKHYLTVLPIPQNSTGNSWAAHAEADKELRLTPDERDLLKRLDLRETFPDIHQKHQGKENSD